MAINTYTGLKTSMANWLARDDLTSYLDDFIDLAEERLARDFLTRYTVKSSGALTLTLGQATIPADFLRFIYGHIQVGTGSDVRYPLEPRPLDWIVQNYPGAAGGGMSVGIPRFIAIQDGKFNFGPMPASDSYVLRIVYAFKPAALSSSNETNEWTDNFPDALLWGCLCESAPFLKDDARALVWEQKYDLSKQRILSSEAKNMRRGARISQGHVLQGH